MREKFEFVVLKYMHDIVSGEAINVGIVAYWPDRSLVKYRLRSSMGRVRQIFPDVDRRTFISSLASLRSALSAQAKGALNAGIFSTDIDLASLIRKALQADDSSFQWSDVGRGLCDDVDEDFSHLYQRFVAKYDLSLRVNRTDEAVWRPVRDQLAERNIQIDFETKVLSGETDEVTFDNAWKNGIWHAYQAVSLDLASAENILDKARRWRGQMAGVADGVDEAVQVSFLLGKPQNPDLQPAYQQALAIFRRLPLTAGIYAEDDVSVLVDSIEDEFREHISNEQMGINHVKLP